MLAKGAGRAKPFRSTTPNTCRVENLGITQSNFARFYVADVTQLNTASSCLEKAGQFSKVTTKTTNRVNQFPAQIAASTSHGTCESTIPNGAKPSSARRAAKTCPWGRSSRPCGLFAAASGHFYARPNGSKHPEGYTSALKTATYPSGTCQEVFA